jgi:UDP-N-acetylmuramate dehydrogenase
VTRSGTAAAALAPAGPALGRLRRALGESRVHEAVPLAPWTTFRIGGPADLFFVAETPDELAGAVAAARAAAVPWFVLGAGANVLVGDRGFRGLVVHNRAGRVAIDAATGRVEAESGALVWPDLVERAVAAGLSGLEHFAGIPSSVGGALWQNLHFLSPARDRTVFVAEVLAGAEILAAEGDRRRVGVEYFAFGYDESILHHRRDVVLAATFALAPAEPAAMRAVIAANLAWRAERHPPLDREPSAGSIFKKVAGVGAGRLIEEAGLKGRAIGGAVISPRHANIVVNRGGATAADVRALVDHARDAVERRTGLLLEPEISFVGEF